MYRNGRTTCLACVRDGFPRGTPGPDTRSNRSCEYSTGSTKLSEESGDRRRFLIDALAVAAATPAAIGAATAEANTRTGTRGRPGASAKPQRPNILIILTDEERYPPPYETGALRQWRETQLPGRALIRKNGLELNRHYIASAACVPSRASFFTGQYPSLHGTSQTDGAAKSAFESNMYWLDPNTVPTLGHYFRAAGYRTYYKGKWHASESDILTPGTKTPLASYDSAGYPDRALEQKYLQADRLDPFGFTGYIGPTPHGQDPRNSGSSALTGPGGRDIAYADQVIGLLDELERGPDTPWLTVLGLVNPHDIVLRGVLSTLGQGFNFSVDPTVPHVPPAPTADEQLLPTKPIPRPATGTPTRRPFSRPSASRTSAVSTTSCTRTWTRRSCESCSACRLRGSTRTPSWCSPRIMASC